MTMDGLYQQDDMWPPRRYEGLFQQQSSWRTRTTSTNQWLKYILAAPNPIFEPTPPPACLQRRNPITIDVGLPIFTPVSRPPQFPRELSPWGALMRRLLGRDDLRKALFPPDVFDPSGWLTDPLADVRASLQQFLDAQ